MMIEDELPTELDYDQLLTLWNIAGKPTDTQSLAPMLNSATLQAEKRFLTKAKVGIVESLLGEPTLLSARTYTILARDRRVTVRRIVAKSPNTTIDVVTRLATDEDVYVRRGVVGNPNTPIYVLIRLARDEDLTVRALARNIVFSIVVAFDDDGDPVLRWQARRILKALGVHSLMCASGRVIYS